MAGMKSLTLAVAMAALAFSGLAHAEDKGLVAVAMPTKSSARWIADGDNMVKVLKERGYQTDLQYAEDDVPNQLAQIENMVTKGAKVLVVASIDGTTLSDVLAKAHDAGIKVIAYDRLIRDTPNVDYYATFDNFQVGVLQAQSIEKALDLKNKPGPFNIELSAARRTITTHISSTTARCRCCSLISIAARSLSAAARPAWTRWRPCAGTAQPPRLAWI